MLLVSGRPRSRTRRTRRTRRTTLITLAVLAPGLAACTGGTDPGPDEAPDPRPAATALAEALTSGDLGDAPLAGDVEQAQASYDAAVAALVDAGVTPRVGVGQVVPGASGDAAEVRLDWSWPVSDDATWTYTSGAPLRLVAGSDGDEQWEADFSRAVVEPSLRPASTLSVARVPARRGDVLGAGGSRLVTERIVNRFGLDKTQVRPARALDSARAVAQAADVDVAAFVEAVRAAGEAGFVEAIALRDGDVTPAVREAVRSVDGASIIGAQVPLAPTREFAASILGRVGPVTAEMVEEDPARYRAGDVAGTSGLQARYDDQLRGQDGVVVSSIASDDRERALFRVRPQRGTPLRLTLDQAAQSQAESLLSGLPAAAGGSALVAVRPSDGAILAAAEGPASGGLALATFAQVPPGSTFKTVSSLALLRAGLRPDSPVECPTSVVVDGKRFENYDGYPASASGPIDLRTAVAQSCNTALIGARDRARGDALAEAAGSLGLGVDHDLGFPAYLGEVEPPASETELAADMIGQGTVLASPMAMAGVIASVQAGRTVVPHLVVGQEAGDDTRVADATAPTPLDGDEAEQLRSMLRAVVSGGSGSLLADLPGPPAIAKTGTAEFEDPQADGAIATHAWMVGAQGDLAVAVYVERGDSGSGTAGPVLEAFLRSPRG